MNAITVDTAISLFPEASFEKNLNLYLGRGRPENCRPALKKYEERGWKLVEELTEDQLNAAAGDELMFWHGKRWVQDSHTWRLPLDTTGIQFDAQSDPTMMAVDKSPPNVDPMLLGGFNVTCYEDDQLSQVTFGLVNTKIFTSRFITNRETTEKLEIFDMAVKHLAERTLGRLALSPKQ